MGGVAGGCPPLLVLEPSLAGVGLRVGEDAVTSRAPHGPTHARWRVASAGLLEVGRYLRLPMPSRSEC